MLWEGQEFADDYQLPPRATRIRRDMHWEYFYNDPGSALIRFCSRSLGGSAGTARPTQPHDSYFSYEQSLQGGTGIASFHRHAAADAGQRSTMVY